MAKYRLSTPAEAQIDEILDWSEQNFGELARERYAALLVAAMDDVAGHPRQKTIFRKRLASGEVGIYHIRHSRKHVPDPPGQVGDPRHILIFRIAKDGIIDILGFIHDNMLLKRALRRLLNADRENE
ncbi:type II toxin-antitoxin system RelE/ParE family toxin [Mesorhizobium sp. B2-4-17]|uniref:type II toxin-antitoxin system RelE/ParE family toxin n=1 Tax=Mesorhizobium sp. B2-4-17 TaxID=2589932 RepID=UPI0015E2DCB1|nr:type II toxin-antitoxin system RelE/ParE family toxin [Mesorhizobium sp. B2-4-17]